MRQVINNPAASPVTQIGINIRHGHTFRIQESFKQKIKFQRIQFRDVKKIGNNTSCRTASARTNGYAMRFGKMNEIHNDKEIIRETHSVYDSQFVI